MGNRNIKSFQRLATQSTSTGIGYSSTYHNRQLLFLCIAKIFLNSKNGSLCIKGIKNCFYQQEIHSTIDKPFYLLIIGFCNLIKSYCTETRINYIWRKA